MNDETMPAARPSLGLWKTRTLTLLVAAFALLPSRAAFAQQAGFTVGTNLVDLSKAKGNETDPSIVFNPSNPTNMVVVAATDRTNGGLFFAYSTNGGALWTTNFIATNGNTQGLTATAGAYATPSVAFDANSNLYLAYIPSNFLGVAIAASTNGGQTFASLGSLATLDVTEQPRLAAPPAGSAAGSLWVVYKDYTTVGTPLQVQGMLSTNLGGFGTFGPVQIVPGSSNGGFSDIAVGPLGQVVVAYQDNLGGSQPSPSAYPVANIFVNVETNGVISNSISTNGFGPAKKVATDAIGGVTYIDAAPDGIGINAAPGLAWNYYVNSSNYNSCYLIYTAVGPNGNAVIGFMSAGASNVNTGNFQGKKYVDDDATTGYNGAFNDHFLPRIAVDPISGVIGCSWYDCRFDEGMNSPGLTNVLGATVTLTNSKGLFSTITNISVSPSGLFFTNFDNSTPPQGTNFTIILTADNIFDPTLTLGTATSNSVTLDIGTNFVLTLGGDETNGGTFGLTVIVTNIITTAYTTGNSANTEALMFTTLSTNGGKNFDANQQLISAKTQIYSPAIGLSSGVAGSSSLTGWGHYTGLAAYGAHFFPVWADNADVPTNNPDKANVNFDINLNTGTTFPYANITIFVTNSPNSIISQEQITYSVIVTNRGASAASPVTITNIISTNETLLPNSIVPPLGSTFNIGETTNGQQQIVFVIPSMASGAVATSTFRVTAGFSSYATNYASVYSGLFNLNPTNLLSTNQWLLINGEALSIGMTASETNAMVWDTVFTTINVTNLGPSANSPVFVTNAFSPNWTNVSVVTQSQGTYQITNSSSGQIAIVDFGLMPDGTNATVTFSSLVLGGANYEDATNATELAWVASQDVNTNIINSSADLRFPVSPEVLPLSVQATPASQQAGQVITFTESLSNQGLNTNGVVLVTNSFSTNLGSFAVIQPTTGYTITSNSVAINLGALNPGQVVPIIITAVSPVNAVLGTNTATATDHVTVSSQDYGINLLITTNQAAVTITPALPMFSNVVVTASSSSAFISFNSGYPATVQVMYGLTTNYTGFTPFNSPASLTHVELLTGLTPGTTYNYEILGWVSGKLYTTNLSFSTIGTNNTIILNTQDAYYSGLWSLGTGLAGTYPTNTASAYQYSTSTNVSPLGTASAIYEPSFPASALYNVYIWYPQNATFTSNGLVYVYGATNDVIRYINQTTNGDAWLQLASDMYFTSGLNGTTNGNVTLYNFGANTGKYMVANAMMWVYDGKQDYPAVGNVPAWWADFYYGTGANGYVNGSAMASNGYSIYDDFVLGADPTSTNSLNFTVTALSTNEVSVTFSPWQGGRSYELQAATNLADPVWNTLTNQYALSTNGAGVFTVAQTNAASVFYRLSAQLETSP